MRLSDGFYDMHTHILPCLDDGARSLYDSMQMIDIAYEEGIRRIVATPHYVPGNVEYDIPKLRETADTVSKALKDKYPDMELYTGNELYFREGTEKILRNKEVLTMADSDYLLVEFNEQKELKFIREAIHKITEFGYRPIIAHIERYTNLRGSVNTVEELIQLGAYIQVNSDTITGGFMNPEHRFSDKLLREKVVHFVGSDCHSATSRKPQMKEAVKYLVKKTGEQYTEKIICENMDELIHNRII